MSNRSKKYGVPGEISASAVQGQKLMFREAKKVGFSPENIAGFIDVPPSTVKGWASGTPMPITGFAAIANIDGFPNELLSFVLPNKSIHDAEADETDYDDLARKAIEYVALHAKARHPNSPGNIRIVHSEEPDLRISARGLKSAAKKVAA